MIWKSNLRMQECHLTWQWRYRRIDRERKALRIPAMRGTIFLVPRRDAARIFTAVRPVATRVLRALRRQGLSTRDYERCAKRILAAAREPRPARDLQDAASTCAPTGRPGSKTSRGGRA